LLSHTSAAQESARHLVAVHAPEHAPLYVDPASIERHGGRIRFKYVLDVFVEFEGKSGWKSNEVEATLECGPQIFAIRRVTAYPGPRAGGKPTGVHSFMSPAPKPEKITPRSTFAHLSEHLCRTPNKPS
jgi:hypothetical protein